MITAPIMRIMMTILGHWVWGHWVLRVAGGWLEDKSISVDISSLLPRPQLVRSYSGVIPKVVLSFRQEVFDHAAF